MSDTGLPPLDVLERMYEVMRTITVADERARAEAKAGRLPAAFYPVRGMEGVCAALGAVLRTEDHLVSTYRNLGDTVAKGVPLRDFIAEIHGRVPGTSKGKAGTMHVHHDPSGLMATTGIVGSGLPIATGLALAAQLDARAAADGGAGGDGRAVAVTFGDGATSIGAYHEAMNLAALWRLPLVFVCQNNGWAEHTPISAYAPNGDLAARAAAYNLAAATVDGFDPIETWRVLGEAAQRARTGGGPTFVECRTYRLVGHTSSADYSYMPKSELEAALARDPAPTFRTWLVSGGHATEARLDEIDKAVEAAIDDAFEFAQSAPQPAPAAL
ncbi:MAG TPA: thiamine pyrophosphate-dependent dehydrogenase E1 component subunit alpha [Acidimicrobiia bacterium]|nr:thiamine pyrophosphate-dependent dehydrogenase E1 component subunit alpha [Acidimicrobiia bacterium]